MRVSDRTLHTTDTQTTVDFRHRRRRIEILTCLVIVHVCERYEFTWIDVDACTKHVTLHGWGRERVSWVVSLSLLVWLSA